VTARSIALLSVLAVIALAGCGSSDSSEKTSSTIVGGADSKSVEVIKGWADELRAGDVAAASRRFALPSVVQNGTPALTLTSRSQVVAFNRSLPCGARLTAAVPTGRFTVATFVLTERPGPGQCGDGVGEQAKTAFVIRDGLITQWRRVVDTGPPPSSTGPVV
jgi:limonene-1,2-epoxide hydrolase